MFPRAVCPGIQRVDLRCLSRVMRCAPSLENRPITRVSGDSGGPKRHTRHRRTGYLTAVCPFRAILCPVNSVITRCRLVFYHAVHRQIIRCKSGDTPRCKLFRIGKACCVIVLPRFSLRLPWGCSGPLLSMWCPLCINVDYMRFYAVFRLFCPVFRCYDGAGACLKTQKGNFSRVYVRFVVRAALVCTIHCTPGPCFVLL